MPMFNLNNDDVEESLIKFTAGEPGELGLYIHGEENCTVHLHKSENAIIWWRPDRADEEDAWGDSE